jgi:hypothetical protein
MASFTEDNKVEYLNINNQTYIFEVDPKVLVKALSKTGVYNVMRFSDNMTSTQLNAFWSESKEYRNNSTFAAA